MIAAPVLRKGRLIIGSILFDIKNSIRVDVEQFLSNPITSIGTCKLQKIEVFIWALHPAPTHRGLSCRQKCSHHAFYTFLS